MKPTVPVLLVFLLGLSLGACDFINSATEGAAFLLISPAQEVDLGLQLTDELEGELTIHCDPVVQQYINDRGQEMLAANPQVEIPQEYVFQFHVVDDPNTINAFAVPGGQIYFYTGLILAARTEAEVMGVLGHEIAHVTERHGAQRMVTQFGIESLTGMVLGQNASGIGALVANVATTGALLTYSRDNELEADRVGLRYMVNAGYNPQGLIDFFDMLDAQSAVSLPEFLSTHPDPSNRVQQLEERIADRYPDPPTYDGDAQRFAQWQADIRANNCGGLSP